jgi:CBS domain-containing protein
MSTDVVTVRPDLPLVETLLILYRTKTSIPVVDPKDRRLVGMISYFDVGEKILAA